MFATLIRNASAARPQRAFENCFKSFLMENHMMMLFKNTRIPTNQSLPKGQQQGEALNTESFQIFNNLNSIELEAMNRNGRRPKKANHGRRPVCRAGRRAKNRKWGNPRR